MELINQSDLTKLIDDRPEEIYIIIRDFLKKKGIKKPSEDLLQDMAVGFLVYADKYDEKFGVRPLTYLYKCLEGLLKRRGKLNNLVRPSMAYHAKILQTMSELTAKYKSDRFSLLEVAKIVGCPIEAVLKSIYGVYSVNTLVTHEEGSSPWDVLLSNSSEHLQKDHLEDVQANDLLEFLFNHLSEEEKFIVMSRVGIYPKKSLKELGDIFDLSKERIRQIENKAYSILRQALILQVTEKEAKLLLKLIVNHELKITDENETPISDAN